MSKDSWYSNTRSSNRDPRRLRWWPIHWTTPLVGEPPRPISLFDLAELRAVVDVDRVAAGLAPMQWVGRSDDDPRFQAGITPIRARHVTQIRTAIGELWEVADLGPIPEFRAGPIVPGTRRISVRDPLDLRGWLETYEDAAPNLAARLVWRPSENPALWPTWEGLIPPEPVVELWDGTGHSLFWQSGDNGWTELRRIDTAWYRTDLRAGGNNWEYRLVALTPAMEVLLAEDAVSDSLVREIPQTGWPSLNWPPAHPVLDLNWTCDRDAQGRVVRVRDGDSVVARLASDGLDRLRKWVTARETFHQVGPGLLVRVGDRG